jgi:hypothetical protein
MAHRCKNEGSISKRENGTYRAQVSVQKGKRISATFKTKVGVLKWLRDQSIKLEHGFDFHGSKITMADYLPQWLEHSKAALRDKTALDYSRTMNKHIIPHLGNPSNQSSSIVLSRHTFCPDSPLSAKIRCNTCTLPTQWTISLPFCNSQAKVEHIPLAGITIFPH